MNLLFGLGQEVVVRAWWAKGKPVRCSLGSRIDAENCYVRPMEGNPHSRWVKLTDIVGYEPSAPSSPDAKGAPEHAETNGSNEEG